MMSTSKHFRELSEHDSVGTFSETIISTSKPPGRSSSKRRRHAPSGAAKSGPLGIKKSTWLLVGGAAFVFVGTILYFQWRKSSRPAEKQKTEEVVNRPAQDLTANDARMNNIEEQILTIYKLLDELHASQNMANQTVAVSKAPMPPKVRISDYVTKEPIENRLNDMAAMRERLKASGIESEQPQPRKRRRRRPARPSSPPPEETYSKPTYRATDERQHLRDTIAQSVTFKDEIDWMDELTQATSEPDSDKKEQKPKGDLWEEPPELCAWEQDGELCSKTAAEGEKYCDEHLEYDE